MEDKDAKAMTIKKMMDHQAPKVDQQVEKVVYKEDHRVHQVVQVELITKVQLD